MDFLQISDLSGGGLADVLELAKAPNGGRPLAGRGAALVFEHPSARTRNATEMAVAELGGHPVTIRGEEVGFDRRESVEDVARTLGCYHAAILARVAAHSTLERMSAALRGSGAAVPVVNLLSDLEHPTQALADLLTIDQCLGGLAGVAVAFIGDSNNVARSLGDALALTGASLRVASPSGFSFDAADVARVAALGGELVLCGSAEEAASDADVLYTDVWISMGEESQAAEKRKAFAPFTIDSAMLARAKREAIVMHCLPAHRGEEITAEVLDGPQSRIWLQAENRLHSIRGLLEYLFDPDNLAK
ncbi:MAG TPA: ornithine carbamoyltransferase [Acidimicrobiales bacterium]